MFQNASMIGCYGWEAISGKVGAVLLIFVIMMVLGVHELKYDASDVYL